MFINEISGGNPIYDYPFGGTGKETSAKEGSLANYGST